MRCDQTVIFSDLDGTLFNSHGEISSENRLAIEEYKARGGKFAISTGREPRNAMTYVRENITNAPSVTINGSAVYDFGTGEYLYTVTIPRRGIDPVIRRVMAGFPRCDVQLYTPAGIVYITPESQANRPFLSLHEPCTFSTPEKQEGEDVYKCMFFAPEDIKEQVRAALEAGNGRDYRIVPGTTDVAGVLTYYELLPVDASKGTAIDSLRADPGLAGRTFIAVGDYWNDYEMLMAADVAVAPANADEGIKKVCRFVTASNNDHAIAHIIRDIIPAL